MSQAAMTVIDHQARVAKEGAKHMLHNNFQAVLQVVSGLLFKHLIICSLVTSRTGRGQQHSNTGTQNSGTALQGSHAPPLCVPRIAKHS
jgi:hypothetical protein